MARPRGILAGTSTHSEVIASPRRLSTWDGGQCKRRISTTAPCRQAAYGGVSIHCSGSGYGYCSPQASCVVALCYRGDALLHRIAMTRHVVAVYAVSWTTLENWSEYFLKNVRTKKRQEEIFQSWFDFDRKVPIEVVYQLSDSVTRITICPEYPAILRHQLPIPDW
ncbi:MAG: hypothetical protein ACK56W_13890 [Pirellula sp.]